MRVGDIRVAYTSVGEQTPVVFVHGLAEDRWSWTYQLEHLEGVRRVAYDLRGHGATSAGAGVGTLAQLGLDLTRFLEHVTGPAICVGFSLGGTIVLWAAARRPELIRQAVVLGTSSVVGRSARSFYLQRIELVHGGTRAAIRVAMREDTVAALATARERADAISDRRVLAIGDGAGYVNAAWAMARLQEAPLTPFLSDVRCHVDVIGAEHDQFCPRKAADILLDALLDASYYELGGAGHLMNVDDPKGVTELLRSALTRKEM